MTLALQFQPVHSFRPFLARSKRVGAQRIWNGVERRQSPRVVGRTLQPSKRRILPADFSHKDVAEVARECAVLAFPEHTAKRLARAGNITPNGGKAVAQGVNGMSLGTFVSAWHADKDFRAAAKMLLLMESELDPDTQRFLAAALQAYQKTRS